jgi:RND family efflux transporter MFP subunit
MRSDSQFDRSLSRDVAMPEPAHYHGPEGPWAGSIPRLHPCANGYSILELPMHTSTAARRLMALTLAAAVTACAAEPPAPPPPTPPEVTVATPERRDVQDYLEFTGETRAFEEVEVRARVRGFLEEVHFTPSQEVRPGQLLFSIEDDTYAADRDSADAEVKRWESEVARTQADLERLEQAVASSAVSLSEVDRARAERDQAEANLLAARARLVQAELDLSYTKIYSPIRGRVNRWFVDPGNLVGSGESTILTTVVRTDPIHAYWEISEAIFLQFLDDANRDGRGDGDRTPEKGEFPAFLGVGTGEEFPHSGWIDFADTSVDSQTGTLQLRAEFPNPDYALFPGLFSRIRLPGSTLPDAVLIEERAIGTDLGGKYVYVVDSENMVERRYVELGPKSEGMIVALSGIEHGERYIVNGLLRARPGLPVTPSAGN